MDDPDGAVELTEPAPALDIGQRIRQLRRHRGLSLLEVARKSGVSRTSLTQIEAGAANPSVGTLVRIADALGIWVGGFFQRQQEEEPGGTHVRATRKRRIDVVPADQRRRLIEPWANWSLELLSPDMWRKLQASLDTHEPGRELLHPAHEGEEFGFVLTGHFELTVDRAGRTLNPGDSLYLMRPPAFTLRLLDDQPGQILWVTTKPDE